MPLDVETLVLVAREEQAGIWITRALRWRIHLAGAGAQAGVQPGAGRGQTGPVT